MNILTVAEFMEGAEQCDIFERVRAEIAQERAVQVLDPIQQKIDRDWSRLGHQVVGAERY